MNVLVLGAAGYLGRRLLSSLKRADILCAGADIGWQGHLSGMWTYDYGTMTPEDLHPFTHIVLLAAHSTVAMCEDKTGAVLNNVSNFAKLLGRLENSGKTLIYASTQSVYGKSRKVWKESDPLPPPVHLYEQTKAFREALAKHYKVRTIGLRLGTVAGFSPNFKVESLFNSFASRALAGKPLVVTTAGANRAILGITDFCRAVKAIIADPDQTEEALVYNLSSWNTTILNCAEEIHLILRGGLEVREMQTSNYSFHADTEAFRTRYNFRFQDTVETVLRDIHDKINLVEKSEIRTRKDYAPN